MGSSDGSSFGDIAGNSAHRDPAKSWVHQVGLSLTGSYRACSACTTPWRSTRIPGCKTSASVRDSHRLGYAHCFAEGESIGTRS